VLAYIFRTILGALVGAFSGRFEWCYGPDFYDTAEREREFPCAMGTFSVKRESISLCFGHVLALKRESISLCFGHV
jgi:hypothetical protein